MNAVKIKIVITSKDRALYQGAASAAPLRCGKETALAAANGKTFSQCRLESNLEFLTHVFRQY